MTTYDYRSIPFRLGLLLILLSCLALINLWIHLQGAMSVNVFKAIIAIWILVGGVGIDVVRNHLKRLRNQRNKNKAMVLPRVERYRV
ncbi:MAG TPA: hypothetical protein DCX06_10810 [Opitutae bacterium]|nr:hypothetical protein [Opitutae bacterium]